jgi:nitrite reductase/ring-hydroxylating ferredoxin subunit
MTTQSAPRESAYTARSASWEAMKQLTEDERAAWRVADFPERANPDERGLPDEYPFGWFGVSLSDELAPGEVKSVRFFGQEMALWRGEDGEPRLIDAFCAHYGANMAVGGTVAGNLLECPFHAWRWDGTGATVEIPYSAVIPPQARRKDCVRSYPVREANGCVWMWYHPDRVEPMWDLMVLPEWGDPDWTGFTTYRWIIYTSLDHFADNAVDMAHFRYTHRTADMPNYEFRFDGIERWVIARTKMGTPQGMVDGSIEIISRGPGQSVTRFAGLADTILVAMVTPIDRDRMMLVQCLMQPRAQAEGPRAGVARALLREVSRQTDEDKLILDRHVRVDPPLICAGDGPLGRNRVYQDQFLASRNPPFDRPEAAE